MVSILVFAIIGCKGDDDDSKKEEEFPTTGVVWKLKKIAVDTDGVDQNYVATECELQSTIEFKADMTFSRKLNLNSNEGECLSFIQAGSYTEDESRVLTLIYTEGENIRDSQRFQITSQGLEESVVQGDVMTGTITGTTYTYNF